MMKMKKLMVLLSVSFLLPSVANAWDGTWEGEYELDNGTKVTRKPDQISMIQHGGTLAGKSLSVNNLSLTPDMDHRQFRQEVLKLGTIKKTRLNFSEGLEAPAVVPGATNKPARVLKKRKAPGAVNKPARVVKKRKTPVVAKKSAPVAKANASRVAKKQARLNNKQAKRQALLKRRQARLAAKK